MRGKTVERTVNNVDTLGIEVSADDDTSFYGKIDNEPCEMFTAKDADV